MFGFKPKESGVLSHWYTPVSNFTLPVDDFYLAIQQELKEQQVPDLKIARVEFAEGGILSGKREYLRMTRERLIFDICAAQFGINYFFSCRFAELPAKVSVFAVALLLISVAAVLFFSFRVLGICFSVVVWPIFLISLIYALRNPVGLGLYNLDAWLLEQPLFGAIYERFLRKETYYRHDTRLMYLTVVEGVVKKLVEQETAAKGVILLTQYEHGPILGDLYKQTVKTLQASPKPKD